MFDDNHSIAVVVLQGDSENTLEYGVMYARNRCHHQCWEHHSFVRT
jgi:hypothetical protein